MRSQQSTRVALQHRRRGQVLLDVEDEGFNMQLAQQLAHAGVLDNGAVVDDADVTAQLFRLFQVVGGENDGDALLIELGEEAPHRTAQFNVHASSGLVEDQQARLVNQRAGNHQTALHATGQRTRRHVALVPQAQLGQVLLGALLGHLGRNTVVARLGDDNVEALLELVEVELLRHHAQAAFERRRLAVQVVAEHVDRAAGLVHQGGEDADGGGLAGTIGAKQGEEVAFGDVQVYALEGLEAVAVGLGQLSNGQGGTHSGSLTEEKGAGHARADHWRSECDHGARPGRTSTVTCIDNDYRSKVRSARSSRRPDKPGEP